jgi:asparagine synthetase B (glutamine-hydrolysing)
MKMVIKSNIIKKEKIVSKTEWFNYIDELKKESKSLIKLNEKEAIKILSEDFINAIKSRIPNKKFGIFFSGGVDSTLISYLCQKYAKDFVCYTVGIEGSQDLEVSKKVAKTLKLNQVTKTLTLIEMENLFEETSKILGPDLTNIVNLGVGAVELAAIKLAKKDNIDIFFGGLGSEEIYAGYNRHEKSENIDEECWNGLKSTYERDFLRDVAIATATKTKFLTPFLDRQLIINSMRVPSTLKINKGLKKYIIRKVALDLGLDEEYAFRPKKAAQYGSNFDKAILKITKSHGFKFKREYLEFLKSK